MLTTALRPDTCRNSKSSILAFYRQEGEARRAFFTRLLFHVRSMSSITIQTWRDLLLPNDQDTHVFLPQVPQVDNTEGQHVQISTFAPQVADPGERLPLSEHLFEEFPSRIWDHLCVILNQSCSGQATGTSFTNRRGRSVTPAGLLGRLQDQFDECLFQHHYETGSVDIMKHLSSTVSGIFKALTETKAAYAREIHSSCHGVVSDFAYLLNDRKKILGEIKSPKVFNDTIGAFMQQISNESLVALCTESELTPYSGHLAIFGKVRAVTSVSCPPSESSLPPAWIPRGRHSAPRPLDNRVQRTQLYHYLHPTDRKA